MPEQPIRMIKKTTNDRKSHHTLSLCNDNVKNTRYTDEGVKRSNIKTGHDQLGQTNRSFHASFQKHLGGRW